MLKGIIIDLDATLVDSKKAHMAAFKNALERFGIDFRNFEWCYGPTSENLIKNSFPELDDELVHKIAERKRANLKNYVNFVKPIRGAVELLEFLKVKHRKIALLTNNTRVELINILGYLHWEEYFDAILGKEDGPPKPNPETVKLALQKLGLEANEVVYIGDSDADILSAIPAKVRMLLSQAVHSTAAHTEDATWIAKDMAEIKSKIKELLET
jgi:HAD superfamily hydrolase (TIGR01509 family)